MLLNTKKQFAFSLGHCALWLLWHTGQCLSWRNDGNLHLHSPSPENSSAPPVRSRPAVQMKNQKIQTSKVHQHKIINKATQKLKLHNQGSPPGKTLDEGRTEEGVGGAGTDPQGWWLEGWKMNETPPFPFLLAWYSQLRCFKVANNCWCLFKKSFPAPSSSVWVRSWKKTPDLCHAGEWVSKLPKARRPRQGWEGWACPRARSSLFC